jgi:hypothetical protein
MPDMRVYIDDGELLHECGAAIHAGVVERHYGLHVYRGKKYHNFDIDGLELSINIMDSKDTETDAEMFYCEDCEATLKRYPEQDGKLILISKIIFRTTWPIEEAIAGVVQPGESLNDALYALLWARLRLRMRALGPANTRRLTEIAGNPDRYRAEIEWDATNFIGVIYDDGEKEEANEGTKDA